MSMCNDLESGAKGNKERCEYNSLLADCAIQMTTIRSNVSRILLCASFSDVSRVLHFATDTSSQGDLGRSGANSRMSVRRVT